MTSPRIAVVAGTRPELIKLAGIVNQLGERCRFVHTGQHWDRNLHGALIDDLELPDPHAQLEIGGQTRASQIAQAMVGLEELFLTERPSAIVVQGDTNTVTAGALTGNAMGIPVVHVEAGLRSYDRRMPEEHNRVVTDHLSDLCLAPTSTSADNLAREAIPAERIRVTGNTVVDAVMKLLPTPDQRRQLLADAGLDAGGYVLSTFHRPENVDDPQQLRWLLELMANLALPVHLPLHPRTLQRARDFGLQDLLDQIQVVEPIPYRRFLGLLAESAMVLCDSGGVQEEISVVKRPAVIVRRSTERPEVTGTFAQVLPPGPEVATATNEILADVGAVHARLATVASPYGDGTASAQSIAAVDELLTQTSA